MPSPEARRNPFQWVRQTKLGKVAAGATVAGLVAAGGAALASNGNTPQPTGIETTTTSAPKTVGTGTVPETTSAPTTVPRTPESSVPPETDPAPDSTLPRAAAPAPTTIAPVVGPQGGRVESPGDVIGTGPITVDTSDPTVGKPATPDSSN